MNERKSIVSQFRDAGQLVVALAGACMVLGGLSVKAWGWVTAGPEAKRLATSVEARVSTIEQQMRFVVFAAEKANKITYKEWARKQSEARE